MTPKDIRILILEICERYLMWQTMDFAHVTS